MDCTIVHRSVFSAPDESHNRAAFSQHEESDHFPPVVLAPWPLERDDETPRPLTWCISFKPRLRSCFLVPEPQVLRQATIDLAKFTRHLGVVVETTVLKELFADDCPTVLDSGFSFEPCHEFCALWWPIATEPGVQQSKGPLSCFTAATRAPPDFMSVVEVLGLTVRPASCLLPPDES